MVVHQSRSQTLALPARIAVPTDDGDLDAPKARGCVLLWNAIIDWLDPFNVGFTANNVETRGKELVQHISDAFFYLTDKDLTSLTDKHNQGAAAILRPSTHGLFGFDRKKRKQPKRDSEKQLKIQKARNALEKLPGHVWFKTSETFLPVCQELQHVNHS